MCTVRTTGRRTTQSAGEGEQASPTAGTRRASGDGGDGGIGVSRVGTSTRAKTGQLNQLRHRGEPGQGWVHGRRSYAPDHEAAAEPASVAVGVSDSALLLPQHVDAPERTIRRSRQFPAPLAPVVTSNCLALRAFPVDVRRARAERWSATWAASRPTPWIMEEARAYWNSPPRK